MDFILFLDFIEDYLIHYETKDLILLKMRNCLLDCVKDLNEDCLADLADPLF